MRSAAHDWSAFTDLEALLDAELRADTYRPVWVTELELTEGVRSLADRVPSARRGQLALVLVRLHTHPLGLVVLDTGDGHPERSWCTHVAEEVGHEIAAHVRADGGDPAVAATLWDPWSIPDPGCVEARRTTLARAVPATVIIATRERPDALARCLASVRRLDYPSFDVVVVDNAPATDRTRGVVERFHREGLPVHYVCEMRRGLAAAHNGGLPHARGAILAFTDDDVVVDRHWLTELVAPFTTDPRVAATTGLILPAELDTRGQAMLEAHGRYLKGFEDRRFDRGEHRPDDPLFPFTAGAFGAGANMAFEAEFLRRSGGFDRALGTGTIARGGDDLAAFFRVIAADRVLAYQPSSIVWHHHRRDDDAVTRQAWDYAVGFSAYLTSALVHDPRAGIVLARRLGAARTLTRERAEARRTTVTPELRRLTTRGMLVGPVAYAASALAQGATRSARPRSPGVE
jgi:GT2 family glycosyltransferase